jgi:capsular polysaccharide transport system ATP-binding protein
MIILEQLTKVAGARRTILSSVNLEIPSDRRIALVGRVEEDKRELINLLAGLSLPTSGRIERLAEVSFPVGELPGVSREHSIRVNVAHVARLYGADVMETIRLVEQIMRLGEDFDKPYDSLPRPLRKPLAAAVAFAVPFDVYLLSDGILQRTIEGRASQRQDAITLALFEARAKTSGMIIATNNVRYAREICEMALLLDNGRLELFADVARAFVQMRRSTPTAMTGRKRQIQHYPED